MNPRFSLAPFLLHHDFLQRKVSAESGPARGEGCNLILMKRLLQPMLHFLFLLDSLFRLSRAQADRKAKSFPAVSLPGKSQPPPQLHLQAVHTQNGCSSLWVGMESSGSRFSFSHPACPGSPSAFIFCGISLSHSSVQIQGGLLRVSYAWNGSWGGKRPVCMRRGPVGPQCLFFC